MSQLVIKYDAFIAKEVHRFFKRYNIKYDNFDDYMQQARLGVINYERTHDIDANNMTKQDHAKIKNEIFRVIFAYMCSDTVISGVNSHNYKNVPKELKNIISLDNSERISDRITPQYIDRSEVESYKFKHPHVISLFLDGYGYSDIARILHISKRTSRYILLKEVKDYVKHSA